MNNFENIIGSNVSSTSAGYDDSGTTRHDMLTGNSGDNVIDGRGGHDTIIGGGGNDTIIGGSGNDTLTGGTGDNDTFVISGRDTITNLDFTVGDAGDKLSFGSSPRTLNLNYTTGGNDVVITSGSHQVTLVGITAVTGLTAANFIFNPDGHVKLTDNNPTSSGTRGNTIVHGGEGDNRLAGGGNDDTINGNGGDDTITGGNGDDTLNGGAGDDTIEGGAGEDTLDGGAGDMDTLSYAGSPRGNSANTRTGVTITLNTNATGGTDNIGTHAEGDTFANTGNFENLTGSSHNDMLTGDSDPNVIKGGSGQDRIIGGGGADILEGGDRGDWLTAGSTDAFLSYEGSGSVTVNLSDITPTRTLTENEQRAFGTMDTTVSNTIKVSGSHANGDIATGFNHVIGGRSRDNLTGNDQPNELRGMGGNDVLNGGVGGDILKGGEGGDELNGGAGADMLDGGPGGDELNGGGTDDDGVTDTATYDSAMEGVTVDLSGNNLGRGDAAGDTYDHIEVYLGSQYDDTFISGEAGDNINGGDGRDTVSYERSEEAVTVNLTDGTTDSTEGSYANGDMFTSIENIIGSDEDDTLTAGDSGSVIEGGKGDDDLAGGSGSDIFVFTPGDDGDEITGFTEGSGAGHDRIDLSAFSSIASMDDLEDKLSVLASNTDTKIDFSDNDDDEIILYDVLPSGLTADNFIFYDQTVNGSGSNVLEGDLYNNTMNGMGGNDRMYGEKGRDTMNGGAGDDEMYGGEDKDILNGGEGDDLMDGGPGADTFVFEPGNGNDHIMDFTSGGQDRPEAFTDENGTAIVAAVYRMMEVDVDNYVIDLSDYGGGMNHPPGCNQ